MSVFKSRWDDWKPDTGRCSTDKTDKSPSVSFVSAPPRGFFRNEPGNGSTNDPLCSTDKTDKRSGKALSEVLPDSEDPSRGVTDKTDRSPRKTLRGVLPEVASEWTAGIARLRSMTPHQSRLSGGASW